MRHLRHFLTTTLPEWWGYNPWVVVIGLVMAVSTDSLIVQWVLS